MPVYEVDGKTPTIHDTVYISDGGTVIGAVTLAEEVTVWSGVVIPVSYTHLRAHET